MPKAPKGFSRLSLFPVTKNDAPGYTTGTKVAITGAQTFTATPEVSEWKINADDGIYASGADFNGIKFTLTLAECPLDIRKYFEGGNYNATSKEYTYKTTDQQPELAMSFRVVQIDGTSLMVKLLSLKCSSFKMDYKTKGESGDISSVTIEGLIQNRVQDNAIKIEKEAAQDADLTWLDTIVAA